MKKFIYILIVFFIFLILPKSAFASTLTLSPASGSIYIGSVTSVQVRLNAGGDSVNAVSAFLSYPADKLEVAWVTPGSAFAIEAEKSFGSGVIKISRGNLSGVSGNVNVATIGFRGKSAGSATVAFIGGSAAPRASDSSDSLNLGGSSGGVFNVAAGAPKPSPASSPVASSSSSITQLIISDLTATAVATNGATINWKTNGQSDSLVEYGVEKDKYFLSASDGNLSLNHSIKLENSFLTPGLEVHYRVKSKDDEEHEAVSEDQLLQLTGYQVVVQVVDEAGNPLPGLEVLLYSDPKKAVTDTKGEAVFNNVSPGKHIAVVKLANGQKTQEVEVFSPSTINSDKTATGTVSGATAQRKPNYTVVKINPVVKQPATNLSFPQILVAVGIIILLTIVAVVVIVIKKNNQSAPPSSPGGGTAAPQITVTPVDPNINNLSPPKG